MTGCPEPEGLGGEGPMWVGGILLITAIALSAAGGLMVARRVIAGCGPLTARKRLHVMIVFLAFAVFLGGAANYLIFFGASVVIGGDAIAGRVEGGRYYVAS